jgi:hypothetical protein
MQLQLSPNELKPIVAEIVAEVVAQLDADRAKLADAEAFNETTGAKMLGLNVHQLRDERLRGRIGHSKIVGGQIRYTRADILAYLNKNRSEAAQ